MNRRHFIMTSGAAALVACSSPRRGMGRTGFALAQDIESAAGRALALGVAPGISVAVYTREGVYAQGFGVADVVTGERATADTVFYIASSTKSMTSLALAIREARGELDLDATVAEFAPEAPFPPAVRANETRLRHLLSHTGGIANEPIEFRFTETGQHDPDTLWRLLAASEPNSDAPLGRFSYANVGYNITTILTDRRLGVAWQDLLNLEIFGPSGMNRTSARMSRARGEQWSIAKPHRIGPSGARERSYLEKTDQTMHSAGGVVMSANDALRWLELVVEDGRIGGRQIIPAEVVRGTRAPIATVNVDFEGYRRDAYGLGWYIGPYRNERMLSHFGGFNGFRAHISYLPDRHIGVAAFVNDSSAALIPVNAIANYVYDRLGGHTDADPRFEDAIAAAATRRAEGARRILAERAGRAGVRWTLIRPRSAYVGAYENAHWGRIEITIEDEALVVACGVLRSPAWPSAESDALWVELEPGAGTDITFEG
ncbi:MAG: serine hydrolase domain-containing protein, partial [Vitreimonas sp.]